MKGFVIHLSTTVFKWHLYPFCFCCMTFRATVERWILVKVIWNKCWLNGEMNCKNHRVRPVSFTLSL